MTNASDAVSQRERKLGRLSLLSLAAAVVGFVGTMVPGANASQQIGGIDLAVVSVGLRIVFLLLAVLLGIFGRRSRAGRIGLIGSGALLAIFLVVTLFLVSRPAPSVVQPTTVQLPE